MIVFRLGRLVGVVFCGLMLAGSAMAEPRGRTMVMIDPHLASSAGKINPESVANFARRIEEVLKWKPGTLQAQAFSTLEEAKEFIAKEKPTLGFLAPHAFVQLNRARQVEVLGYASPIETKYQRYTLISRSSDNLSALPHQNRNLRLASNISDMQWLNVVFDGTLNPYAHFQHVAVASEADAVDAVMAKRADVALVWGEHTKRYSKHLSPNNLRISFNSAKFPPLTAVVFKQGAKADVKAVKSLVKAMPEVCKGSGNIERCAAVGFHFMTPGEHELHPHLIYKYEKYK